MAYFNDADYENVPTQPQGLEDPLAPPLSGGGVIGDVLFAPLRGLEGFARSIYELGDMLLLDSLPDQEKFDRIFGRSQTVAGGLIEGITQFGVGFALSGGAVGLLGKAVPALAKGAKLAALGQKLTWGERAAVAATNITRGAIADFASFESSEKRLSDFLIQFPQFQNPLFEALSSNPGDNKWESRFKSTVEGLGLGAATDIFLGGAKALKNIKEYGMDLPENQAFIEAAIERNNSIKRALELEGVDPAKAREEVIEELKAGPNVEKAKGDIDDLKGAAPQVEDVPTAAEILQFAELGKEVAADVDTSAEWARSLMAKGVVFDPAMQAPEESMALDMVAEFIANGFEGGLKGETIETLAQDVDNMLSISELTPFFDDLGKFVEPSEAEFREAMERSFMKYYGIAGGELIEHIKKNGLDDAYYDLIEASSEKIASDAVTEATIREVVHFDDFTRARIANNLESIGYSGYDPIIYLLRGGAENERALRKKAGTKISFPEDLKVGGQAESPDVRGGISEQPKAETINIAGTRKKVSSEYRKSVAQKVHEASLISKDVPFSAELSRVWKEISDEVQQFSMSGGKRKGTKGVPLWKDANDNSGIFEKLIDEFNRSSEHSSIFEDLVNEESVDYLVTKLSQFVDDTDAILGTSFEDYFNGPVADAMRQLYRYTPDGLTGGQFDDFLKEAATNNEEARKIMIRQDLARALSKKQLEKVNSIAPQALTDLRNGHRTDVVAMFTSDLERLVKIQKITRDVAYLRGFGLRSMQENPADSLMFVTKTIRQNQDEVLRNMGDMTKDTARLIEVAQALVDSGGKTIDPVDAVKIAEGLALTGAGRNIAGFKNWYKNNLLMSPATGVVNIIGNFTKITAGSFERYLGAKTAKRLAWAKGDEVAMAALEKDAKAAMFELRAFFGAWQDGIATVKKTFAAGGEGTLLTTKRSLLEDSTGALGKTNPADEAVQEILSGAKGKDLKATVAEAVKGQAKNYMSWHTLPGRLMGSLDEGFKTLAYDSAVKSLSYRRALELGLKNPEEYAESILTRSKVGGVKMTSDKAYQEYAHKIATDKLAKKYGEGLNSMDPAKLRTELRKETELIYEAINPAHQIELDRMESLMRVERGEMSLEEADRIYRASIEEFQFVEKAAKEAERRALEGTFQQEFNRDSIFGGVASSLQKAAARDTVGGAAMTTVLPFVRTPYNVVTYSLDVFASTYKVPLAMIKGKKSQLRQVIDNGLKSNDPTDHARALEALGRAGTGSMLIGMAWLLAKTGMLTGTGPVEAERRDLWLSQGIQPKSIKIPGTDTWVQYERVEPLATIFGIIADCADGEDMTTDEEQGIITALAVSAASNVLDKTFLTSVSGFLDAALSGDERKVQRFVNNMVSPMIASPGVAAVERGWNDDGTFKELRTLADAIRAKTPGDSGKVDPRRNLLGEAISREGDVFGNNAVGRAFEIANPFYTSAHKKDPLMDEIRSYNMIFRKPDPKIAPGVDLRDFLSATGEGSVNDERSRLVGEIKLGGLTLRERLMEMIQSDYYRNLPATGASGDFKDPRGLALNRILSKYRLAALQKTLQGNPEVFNLYRQAKLVEAQSAAGVISPVDAGSILGF